MSAEQIVLITGWAIVSISGWVILVAIISKSISEMLAKRRSTVAAPSPSPEPEGGALDMIVIIAAAL